MERIGRKRERRNVSVLGKSVAGNVVVFMIAMILMGTTFSAATIQKSESLTPQLNEKMAITWDVTMNFVNPGGQNDYAVFGEAPDARDGPPADTYDVAKPPAPMTPYIRAYLKDGLPTPLDKLWKDYRQYPDTQKTWNLSVQWYPTDEETPTTLTMSWSTTQVHQSEYTTVNLCTNTGTVLKNMLVDSTYTFTCPALTTQNFKIICQGNIAPNIPSTPSGSTSLSVGVSASYSTSATDPDSDQVQYMFDWDASGSHSYSGWTSLVPSGTSGSMSHSWSSAGTYVVKAKARDEHGLESIGWSSGLTVVVTSVNLPPVVTDIPSQTIAEGSTFATISLDNYVSDPDNTDAQMIWTYSGNSQLTVSIVSRVATITVPNADWFGAETITFKATDLGGLWDDDAAVFTVTAVNDPPVVSGIPDQTIAEGSTFATISLDNYVSDVDNTDVQMTWTYSGNTALTVSIVSRVATITIPNADWFGAETITFKATDLGGLWDDDAAVFTVTAVNDPPVVSGIPDQTIAEGSTFATISLDNYVSDVDNTDAEMTWTYSGNSQLTVSIVSRVATITVPNPHWNGAETITFKATDLGGLWDDDAAIFTVTAANKAPVVSGIPDQTIPEGSSFATISLDNYVSDPDNTDAEMTWTYSGNTALTVSIVSRVATITVPNADWNGAETITFKATDPGSLFSSDAAVFTVTAVNDPPVVAGIPDQTIPEGSTFATISLDNYVSDPDNTDAEMTWTYSGNTALTVSIVSRVATITVPNADWNGAETITFKATDPGGLFSSDAAVFTVFAVNDAPRLGTPSPANGSSGNQLSLSWSIPINDVEGNAFSWTIQCSNGQVNSGTGASNGTKSLSLSGLTNSKTYKVWVNATDPTPAGSGLYTRRWYTFTTKSTGNNPPVFGNPSPANGSTGIPLSLTWTIPITDLEGNPFSWSIECSNGQKNSATGASNGNKTLTLSGLASSKTYKIWVNATDPTPAGSGQYTRRWYTFTTQQQQNLPPNKPDQPSGTNSGKIKTVYTYTTSTIDPNGDQVLYMWDWGDGTQSAWLGPYNSGVTTNTTHTWTKKGSYSITVKAKDTFGAESPWSDPLPITMPTSTDLLLAIIINFNSVTLGVQRLTLMGSSAQTSDTTSAPATSCSDTHSSSFDHSVVSIMREFIDLLLSIIRGEHRGENLHQLFLRTLRGLN